MNAEYFLKRIRAEAVGSGQFLIYGLRDLPGKPLEGGPYVAARAYDEHTANLLVEALKDNAQALLGTPPVKVEVGCRLPIATLKKAGKKKRMRV